MLNDAGFYASGKANFPQEYCMSLKGFPTVIFQGKLAKHYAKKTSQTAFWRLLNRSNSYCKEKGIEPVDMTIRELNKFILDQ